MVNRIPISRSLNIHLEGPHKKVILTDVFLKNDGLKKPVIIFSHGFKGFKDWGHFNLMAENFAEQGFVFVKFNFSHNGTTPATPDDFADLEAFGRNNFSIEMDDLGHVINWLEENESLRFELDFDNLFLVGHSRGGCISLLKANEDPRIKKLVTWASPSNFEDKFRHEEVIHWKQNGVIYVENARTLQKMPLYYQIVEDYYKNRHRVNPALAAQNLKIPHLIVQGTEDDVVSPEEARQLNNWNKHSNLFIVEGGDHTFGATHPFNETVFPEHFSLVFRTTCEFLKSITHVKT